MYYLHERWVLSPEFHYTHPLSARHIHTRNRVYNLCLLRCRHIHFISRALNLLNLPRRHHQCFWQPRMCLCSRVFWRIPNPPVCLLNLSDLQLLPSECFISHPLPSWHLCRNNRTLCVYKLHSRWILLGGHLCPRPMPFRYLLYSQWDSLPGHMPILPTGNLHECHRGHSLQCLCSRYISNRFGNDILHTVFCWVVSD